jgi:hypothetical protein
MTRPSRASPRAAARLRAHADQRRLGAQRACRARGPGARALVLVPLQRAGPASAARAARAPRRRPMPRRQAAPGHRQLPALGPWPLCRLAPPGHPGPGPGAFLGDYIYEYPSSPTAPRRTRAACCARWTSTGPATPSTRRPGAAGRARRLPLGAGVGRPRGRERLRRHAPSTPLGADMGVLRAAAYQAFWEHQPLPRHDAARGADMPLFGRLDWGRLARMHLLDTRQHRDVQACPAWPRTSGGAACVRPTARHWPTRRAACWAPRRKLAGRWLEPGPALEPAGAADADGTHRHRP